MKNKAYVLWMATAVFPMLFIDLQAAALDGDSHAQQEAHRHGLVEMTLALAGNRLELHLESPAATIVGFERLASSPEQRARVIGAKAILESPEKLLRFAGTRCQLMTRAVDVSNLLGGEVDAREEGNHHIEDGHEEHADEKHADHADKGHADREAHSEISAHYQFDCEQGASLTAITVRLFEVFPAIETVRVMWVTERDQAAAVLTVDSTTIDLR